MHTGKGLCMLNCSKESVSQWAISEWLLTSVLCCEAKQLHVSDFQLPLRLPWSEVELSPSCTFYLGGSTLAQTQLVKPLPSTSEKGWVSIAIIPLISLGSRIDDIPYLNTVAACFAFAEVEVVGSSVSWTFWLSNFLYSSGAPPRSLGCFAPTLQLIIQCADSA